jgi:hypothetical protein
MVITIIIIIIILRSDRSKMYTFAMNTVSILVIERTIASIKYDRKKQLKF